MSLLPRSRFPGERSLVAGIAIDALGSGMYVPFTLVFFQHVTKLPLPTIGLVLTVTGLLAMSALPIAGVAVDRFGAKRVQLSLYFIRGIGFALYPLAHGIPAFAVLALITAAGTRAFPAAQQARIAELVDGADRERMQALTRSLSNAGLGGGTLIASTLIALVGGSGYLLAAWLNAGSFLLAAVLAARTPASVRHVRDRADNRGGYRLVAKDRPFLVLTVANLLVALGYSSLSVLLPVFATDWLHLPEGLTGIAFVVNTVLCATLSVPVAALARRRFATRTRAAAFGAGLFTVAFLGQVLLGVVRPHNAAVLVTALVVGVVVATAGELVHGPSSGALSQAAAPAGLRGRYMASYQLSWSMAYVLAPTLFTTLLDVDGRLPWLLVAVTSAFGGLMLLRVEHRLPAEAVNTPRPPVAGKQPVTAA
ncbi:multidrug resistance protein MdtH [Kitasatospora phosalacinea]|uniref:Multidrug resistance protein MdtH n=1 Tax=Kitasatospora phosalacinea TaxID=2065 RepID=A0A9W6QE24_9ACTN|nr:MFS transporter [Kitasatospora phosalacinea]GLW73266.1 multidrug resistance protein MdtH [Kitasatospora phosalacinea]